MTEFNPYEAPQQDLIRPSGVIEGKLLVLNANESLPDCCVKCGEPGGRRYDEKLVWVTPWVYLALLVNILVVIVLYLIFNKKTQLAYSLCEHHVKQRRLRLVVLWMEFLVFLGVGFVALVQESSALGMVALLVFLVWVLTAMAWQRTVTLSKVKDGRFWIKGADEAFLDIYAKQARG